MVTLCVAARWIPRTAKVLKVWYLWVSSTGGGPPARHAGSCRRGTASRHHPSAGSTQFTDPVRPPNAVKGSSAAGGGPREGSRGRVHGESGWTARPSPRRTACSSAPNLTGRRHEAAGAGPGRPASAASAAPTATPARDPGEGCANRHAPAAPHRPRIAPGMAIRASTAGRSPAALRRIPPRAAGVLASFRVL